MGGNRIGMKLSTVRTPALLRSGFDETALPHPLRRRSVFRFERPDEADRNPQVVSMPTYITNSIRDRRPQRCHTSTCVKANAVPPAVEVAGNREAG